MDNRPKTIFCDIDGTLIEHCNPCDIQTKEQKILDNTIVAIKQWDRLGYNIILTTGRKESLRELTHKQLSKLGILYDQLIMGIGGGSRILINDTKPNKTLSTAYSINVVRNKGIQHYDFTGKYITIKDNQPTRVEKPWGSEELIEYNDRYVVKKLFMKKGECCSLQYHELKRETMYVISGTLNFYYGKDINNLKVKIMKAGDYVNVEPFTLHRMEGKEDSTYLETSTVEVWDVVRLQDKYQRENKKENDYK